MLNFSTITLRNRETTMKKMAMISLCLSAFLLLLSSCAEEKKSESRPTGGTARLKDSTFGLIDAAQQSREKQNQAVERQNQLLDRARDAAGD
jgi:hypothetical protein